MGRAPCCDKEGMKRGPWTPQEDQILINYIQNHGHDNWRALPKLAGLLRCGKSCRLRWMNYLRPDIKRGNFTREEEDTIIELHGMLGNRWSAIAARLPGRTDNEIKNVWHTYIKKRVTPNQNQNLTTPKDPPAAAAPAPERGSPENADAGDSSIPASPGRCESSAGSPEQCSSSELDFSSSSAGGSEASKELEGVHLFDESLTFTIDESFWSDAGTEEEFPANGLDFLQQLPLSPAGADGFGHGGGSGDADMGFWYNLFTAGTLPAEIPDF